MKLKLYMHSGSKNHGCEAIVRTTKMMLSPYSIIDLYSMNPEEDKEFLNNESFNIYEAGKTLKHYSLKHIEAKLYYMIYKNEKLYIEKAYQPLFQSISKGDICLSIGGDNYCYNFNNTLRYVNKKCREKGAKTILWGASIEEEVLKDQDTQIDLMNYDAITVRESLTYSALIQAGINKNVWLYPDPAFTLEKKEYSKYKKMDRMSVIGLNLSPLITQYEQLKDIVINNYCCLIEYILKNTKSYIALIPHVTKKGNDDREILKKLLMRFSDKKRIIFVSEADCMRLKWVISCCQYFIGTRTHATIAAYSSFVPTLVVGYSIKARGIAKDIFGTEENYVLPVQQIKGKTDLLERFIWLQKHEKEIKEHLLSKMPEYVEKARAAQKILTDIGLCRTEYIK